MKRTVLIISFCVLILLIGVALLLCQAYLYKVKNFTSLDGQSHSYYIYPNSTLDSVMTLIKSDYKPLSIGSWQWQSQFQDLRLPQAGYYVMPSRMSNQRLINDLKYGRQTPIRLTFRNNIRTNAQLSVRLASQLLLDSASIASRLDSAAYMRQFGLNPNTAISLFLPDTYEVYWTTTPDKLFERMEKEYKRFWTEERLQKAKSLQMTPTEVTTLASIVESETNKTQEYPIIASLYINRLRIGMPLQACPTAIYANGDFSLKRVLKKHVEIDSPYNTYKNKGLPPGPIRCARALTIDSVLNAPKTDYLYMCANPDFSGTHIFSETYAKHAATAHRYQQELNRRHIK